MHATLRLRKAIWHQQARVNVVNTALNEAAQELEDRLKSNIDQSQPSGRTYRLETLTGRFSARGIGNRRRGTTTRAVIGATFYRASAPGQPPAIRTGRLYRGITVRRNDASSIRANVNQKYGTILDDPNRLNRPFFKVIARAYFRNEFTRKIKSRIRELL